MWFNSTIREKSYQYIYNNFKRLKSYFDIIINGTAWLSTARVVKCNIKLLNERNLFVIFKNYIFLIHLLQNIKYFINNNYCLKQIKHIVKIFNNIFILINLGDVKSLWSRYIGLHMCYKNKNN